MKSSIFTKHDNSMPQKGSPMSEKRKFERYSCSLDGEFDYFEGNPDEIGTDGEPSAHYKGAILDISRGGVFIVSDARVAVHMPVTVTFSLGDQKITRNGTIARTGLLRNNPSEVAKRFAHHSASGDNYTAIEFKVPLESLNPRLL